MRKILVILLIVGIAFILLKASRSMISAPKVIEPTEQIEEADVDMIQEVQAFSISGFSESGESQWQVEGESANILADVVEINNIIARSHNDGIIMTLTADEGTFFKASKDIELRKNVIANTDEGTVLKTNRLRWLAETERIVTDDYVYIDRDNMSIFGKGAGATPKMEKVRLDKEIRMRIISAKPRKNGTPSETIITCDGPMEVDYKNYISYFNKNVIIEDGEGRIFADKIIAYFDPGKKTIKKAIAKGNVKIVHKRNTSFSEEAVYLVEEGRVILTGRPKIVISSSDTEDFI